MTGTTLAGFALMALVLFHGASAGVRAAAGRDGRLHHRRTEGIGAIRGMVVAALIVTPIALIGTVDALSNTHRAGIYADAVCAGIVMVAPFAGIAAVALVVTRVASWPVRAFANTVVIGGLEFVRPAVGGLGVATVWWATRDPMVAVLAIIAVGSALLTYRVVTRLWYAHPAQLPPISWAAEDDHAYQ